MTINLLQYAAKIKDLIEEVSKSLPFPCHVVMNVNDDDPEIVINEWVIITFEKKVKETIGRNELVSPFEVVNYIVGYMDFHPATREEPEDADYVEYSECDSPWTAIQDAFMLLIMNDLENAIVSVKENESIKEEEEEKELGEEDRKLVKDAMKDVMNELIEPLKVAFNDPNLHKIP